MLIKINDGTVQSREPLCKSCTEFWMRVGPDGRQEARCVTAGYYTGGVKLDQLAYKCTRYIDATTSKHQAFWKTAWILQTSKSGVPIGFVKNKDYRNANPDDPDFKYK